MQSYCLKNGNGWVRLRLRIVFALSVVRKALLALASGKGCADSENIAAHLAPPT